MSRITVEDGRIVEVTEPKVKYCPLFKKYRDIDEITCDVVRSNIEFRMKDFGLFREDRQTSMDSYITFGVSELLCLACARGIIDAAVVAADGCGTFVSSEPCRIQGMGGRISGMVETSPIRKVIDEVGEGNVLDPATARIDQRAGVEKAFAMGYGKVAVTTPFADDAEYFRRTYGDRIVICAVHTSCISEEDALRMFDNADIITACASKHLRDIAVFRAKIQAGTAVPIYGATETGKEIMLTKMEELGRSPDRGLTDGPRPLL